MNVYQKRYKNVCTLFVKCLYDFWMKIRNRRRIFHSDSDFLQTFRHQTNLQNFVFLYLLYFGKHQDLFVNFLVKIHFQMKLFVRILHKPILLLEPESRSTNLPNLQNFHFLCRLFFGKHPFLPFCRLHPASTLDNSCG